MNESSADVPDEFLSALVSTCGRLDCRPRDIIGCWLSESNLTPWAHNAGGNASGFFQVMPATLVGLGYEGHWDDFIRLPLMGQLPWAERYYWPHRGKLVSPGACYLATFLPALMPHASEPAFVLCAAHGPFSYAYAGNHQAFDPDGKGWITVQDLTDRINRVTGTKRALELYRRIEDIERTRDTDPELIVKAEAPIPVELPGIPYEPEPPKDA